jgi:catechol 2,3-dioxygenase-like lactoylglutathione lyase family enzyme
MPRFTVTGVNIDAPDARALADFYVALAGYRIGRAESDFVILVAPEGAPVRNLSFQTEDRYERPTWPAGPGDQQMQMHLEILVDDLDAAVGHAVACGATVADFQPQDGVRVCLDPAGHPFCLFTD